MSLRHFRIRERPHLNAAGTRRAEKRICEADPDFEQLRTALPVRRVIGPADIAALAVQLMTNAAVTGATFDIEGGQQLVS